MLAKHPPTETQFQMADLMMIQTTRSNQHKKTTPTSDVEFAIMDGGADTINVGGNAWIIEEIIPNRNVQVSGYDNDETIKSNVQIGTAITATDLPDGTTILLQANEATLMGEKSNTLFSVAQMRANNIEVHDKARVHGGKSCIQADDIVIPLFMHDAMMGFNIRKPTKNELDECEVMELSSIQPWNPQNQSEDDSDFTEDDFSQLQDQMNDESNRSFNTKRTKPQDQNPEQFSKCFLHPSTSAAVI